MRDLLWVWIACVISIMCWNNWQAHQAQPVDVQPAQDVNHFHYPVTHAKRVEPTKRVQRVPRPDWHWSAKEIRDFGMRDFLRDIIDDAN